MFSCFGCSGDSHDGADREPLLPQYNQDTARQTRLHEKLHTYQMLRAISTGSMPSNEQVIVHMRSLLSADILNPDSPQLSTSGRALVRTVHAWIKQFIDVLHDKNSDDQIQDFIWHLTQARLNIDTADISARATTAKAKADSKATLRSLQTVGSLLLTNSDFRVFLADVSTIGKEVFSDTALSLSYVSKKAGKEIEPSQEDKQALKSGNDAEAHPAVTTEELQGDAADVAKVVSNGAVEVANEAKESVTKNVGEHERDTLLSRLKQAALKLRQRKDYSESASLLAVLLRQYLLAYSHAASDTMDAVGGDVGTNPEADKAFQNFWKLITSFGSREEWKKAEKSFNAVVEAGKADPEFDELVKKLANVVQEVLTEPEFFDNAPERLQDLRDRSKKLSSNSSIAEHVEELFTNVQSALQSVVNDEEIKKLTRTTTRLAKLLSPTGQYTNGELVSDATNVFVPLLIQAIQYVPIPRLELSTPAVDLLLENLILEPGKTVNNSSFLPFKLLISTQNDIEVRKARFETTSAMKSLLNVKISGMSIAAEDLGYWTRLHSGLLRMTDEGLAGFYLDERGIDISLDIEIGRERIEEMVTLRNVDVRIHHLNYTLSRSKFACLAWLFKPLIRPIVRKALEVKIASAITDTLHMLNRELLFARERLRATRISDPDDMWTFVKAVATRLTPAPDPDVDARVGVQASGGSGVFRGRYAPGSLVRVFEEEGQDAGQLVFEGEGRGWRNEVFDVKTRPVNTWRG